MFEVLPDSWRRVVTVLVKGPSAWKAPRAVAQALHWDVDETTDILASLDESGWIEVWERPEGLAVTLSPLGAERLGVRLVERRGFGSTPCWAEQGEREPGPTPAFGHARTARGACLDYALDPHPSPDEELELAEEAEAFATEAAREVEYDDSLSPERLRLLPMPTRLVGEGKSPWPGPGLASCPICRGGRLDPRSYCLYCDRWGLDHLLRFLRAEEPPGPVDRERPARREIGNPDGPLPVRRPGSTWRARGESNPAVEPRTAAKLDPRERRRARLRARLYSKDRPDSRRRMGPSPSPALPTDANRAGSIPMTEPLA